MQEPMRPNLLNVLHAGLKLGDRKTYLHRIIYIGNFKPGNNPEDRRFYQMAFETNIKLINEEYTQEKLTGLGLFYSAYFINIVEGPEDTINKHLRTLLKSIGQHEDIPDVKRGKVLLLSHHISKRYFSNWVGSPAKPPILLEKIGTSKDPAVHRRHIDTCVLKLYRLSENLGNQPVNLQRAAVDNISDVYQQFLPEELLLDFLLDSPSLMDVEQYMDIYYHIPPIRLYHDEVWPAPEDFVPYDIIGDDKTRKLIYTPEPAEVKEEELGTVTGEVNGGQ